MGDSKAAERDVIHKGTPSDVGTQRKYEDFRAKRREEFLQKVQEGYEEWKQTKTYKVPEWLYGPPKGTLFKVACEDVPDFGDTSYLEFDSARTAFLAIDWQDDFCGKQGYVDVMGYALDNTANPLKPTSEALKAMREANIQVVYTQEGHLPDMSDCPYNKALRSKIIGKGVGIGEEPEGGIGRLLVRGSKSWGIVKEVEPIGGDIVVDKAGKGVDRVSEFFLILRQLDVTHLIITGITADVCVNTIMTQANDLGYWCMLLKDCTGATDEGNYEATIKQTKMQGGVFGWVSDSKSLKDGMRKAGLIS